MFCKKFMASALSRIETIKLFFWYHESVRTDSVIARVVFYIILSVITSVRNYGGVGCPQGESWLYFLFGREREESSFSRKRVL